MGRSYGLNRMPEGLDDKRPKIALEKALLKRVFGYFPPYRKATAVVIACIGLDKLLGLIAPLLVRALIDQAIPGHNLALLNKLVLGLVLLPVATGLIGVLQNFWNIKISQGLTFDLRNALYQHLQRLSLRFYTTTRAGEILSRINNDTAAVNSIVTGTFIGIFTNAITVFATIGILFAMDWRLAILACTIVPLFVLPMRRIGRIRHRLSRETQEKQSELQATTQDVVNLGGFLLMRLFGRAEYESTRFKTGNRAVLDLQLRQAMVGRWMFLFLGVIAAAGPALVYWYGGRRLIQGDAAAVGLSIGTIIAFVAYLSNLYRPVAQLANIYVDLQGAFAVFVRIFEYLDLKPDIQDRPDAKPLTQVRGQIRFEGVTFSYRPDQRPALNQISFTVEPGQLAALVGPSGAGKTTATYLVPRFYDPQAGRILIDGHDLREVAQESLATHTGMVTQETFLFHATIRENLLYARPDATEEDLITAAQAASIHDFIAGLPDGYGTLVGERGFKLSGGEKQRISIARAILKNPRILILDEATSSLDSHSEAAIQSALVPLMRGRTTLVIAHRLSTVLAANVILVLDKGHLVEQGTHPELLARGGLYAQLYETQVFLRPP
jgi:ATP-binding cassette subfamily B protein